MSVTSYAQNFEDIILLRALRQVECGFYIDIGAQDPIEFSVTKCFYDLGWRGINIEPVRHWFHLLEKERARDTNLNIAVSDTPGDLHLYEIINTGLSTTEEVFARRHADAGFDIREVDVPCLTLDSICEANGVGEVHFLKVDCEGAEARAFRGFSFKAVRPWIIVVEATEPLSQKPTYAEWEAILLDHAYHFVYADGLNRFYVADERAELDAAFAYPPNVFDDFVLAAEVAARDKLDSALAEGSGWRMRAEHLHGENERREAALVEHRAQQARSEQREARQAANIAELQRRLEESAQLQSLMLAEASSLENEVGRLHHEVAARDREIGRLTESVRAIHRSTSWRITSPLRLIRRRGGLAAKGILRASYQLLRMPMRFARPLLRQLVQWAWLRSFLVRLVGTDSGLVRRARLFLFGAAVKQASEAQEGQRKSRGEEPLTWQATRVNAEMEQARSRRMRAGNPPRAKGG